MADEIQSSSSASIANVGTEATTNKSPIELENTENNNRLLSTDTHETFVTAITSSNSGEEHTESFVTARGQTPVVLEEEANDNNDNNNNTETLNETMNGAAAILELANELDNNNSNIEESGNNIESSANPIQEGTISNTAAAANILPTVRTPPKTNSTTNNNNNQSIISNNNKSKQRQKELKRLDKLQRRIPPTLDLDYITTSIIGMAPPRSNFNTLDSTTGNVGEMNKVSPKKKRPKGNPSIDLSTYLEKRHTKRYLLFNISDEIIDDRSLLLLNRQIVHLPWGSPRITHQHGDFNRGDVSPNNRGAPPPPSSPGQSDVCGTPGSTTNASQGQGKNNKSSNNNSSGTPSIARVMDICYALHAYLSIPSDYELLPELLETDDSATSNTSTVTTTSSSSKRRHNSKQSNNNNTLACIYCSNGKTRTGVIIACYLKFCNVVSSSLKGFEIFCDRRGIMSSSTGSSNSSSGERHSTTEGRDISSHIPPSLRQFFTNFDTLIQLKHYPYPSSIILSSIQLSGVPVDDMPCIDIYEFGNTSKQLVYSSHPSSGVGHSNNSSDNDENSSQEDMNKLNKWYDEEGIYNIGQLLIQDFTLVCRFGGEFQYDTDDPSKVLFRYVNCPNFINGGGSSGEGSEGDSIEGSDTGNNLELTMVDVDMMRRYADSFDDEDFMLTLIFENVNDEDDSDSHLKSPTQKNRKNHSHRRTISFSSAHGISVNDDDGTKFNGAISNNEKEIILQGWKVLSDAHLSHHALDCEDELLAEFDNDSSLFMVDNTTTTGGSSQHYEIDFKHVALQFTNGDVELAKVELMNGLFKSLFKTTLLQQQPSESLQALQQPVLDDDIQHSVVKEEEEEEEEQSALSAYCSTVGSTDNDYSTLEPDSVLSTEAESALTEETGNDQQEVARDEEVMPSSSQLPSVTSADEEDEDSSELPSAKSDNEEEGDTTEPSIEKGATNEVDLKPRIAAVPPMESESVQHEQVSDTVDESDQDLPSTPKPAQQSSETFPSDDANERRSTAETLDADTTSSEEGSTTNTPFRDPNQSTLLDAIQMRGLKNNMALSPYSDRKKLSVAEGLRSSLLIEIRNKASMKEDSVDHSPPSPSPVEEEEKISEDVNDSENIDPADVELTASPRNEVEQVDESIIEDVNDSEEKTNVASDNNAHEDIRDEATSTKDGQGNSDQVNDLGDDTQGDDTTELVATPTADNVASEKSETLQNVDEVPSKSAWSSRLGFPSDWQALPENGKVLTGFKGRPSDATKPDFDMNSTIDDSMTEMKDEQLPLNKDPTYEKFYRMLKTGLPIGAVKNALQRDGLDPTILDLDPEKSLESQRPSREQEKEIDDTDTNPTENKPTKEPIGDKSPSVWSSRVGYPSEWQALPDKGKVLPEFPALDEALYEMNSSMDTSFGGGRKEVQPPLNKDPVYSKYYRMLKMGLPMGAVKNAIQRDELDPTIMDLDPEKSLESQRPQTTEESSNDQPESGGPMASVVNSVMDACQVCCLPESESKEEEEKTDESNPDPRQTLMAMLNKRTAPPTDTEPQTNTEVEKDTPKTEVEKVSEDESDPDPRAALMSMLSKRAPPTTNEPTNVNQIIPSHMQPVEKSKNEQDEEEEEVKDPRAALMSMLNKRAPPVVAEEAEITKNEAGDKEETTPDPRAALMSMLNKRAPPVVAEEKKNESIETEKAEETEPDPRAALMSMLNKRAPPQEEEAKDESAENKTTEEITPDPRAALMTMLNKRAPPADDIESKTETEEQKVEDANPDPRAALMSMLNKRSPPAEQDKSADSETVKPEKEATEVKPDPRAALISMISKRAPPEPVGEESKGEPTADAPAKTAEKATTEADASPSIRNDPRFAKYFKMLKMGLPMGAVKNAMQRDEQDPTIMDLDPEKSLESQRPPKKSDDDDGPPLNKDPKYAKYFKMLKMGLPKGAVQNAMQRDELDPSIMDLDPTKSVVSQMKNEEKQVDDGPPLKDDPKYSKYFKMLKMGLPMGAVKNAMTRDSEDPSIMDLDPEKSVASQLKQEEEEEEDVDKGPPLKDDPKYTKYFKMLKMGLPKGAVQNAMTRDGEDPSIMDLDPEKSVASQLDKGEEDEVDNGPPLKDDPKYVKYFKMLKMGLPKGAVQNAMARDGEDPSIMDLDPEKSVASQLNNKEEELVDKGPPLKEDPKYVKFFKMLKMGLPVGAVKNALTREGHDPSIMDLDPEKSVEYQQALASGKGKSKKKKLLKKKSPKKDPKKPKVRRKKIFWSPIEESKTSDNSLWSMVKGAYDFESLNVDQDEFESLFTDTSNPADKKKPVKEKPKESKQKKSVQVIDAKRGMNGGIILARIKVDFTILAGMVNEMDCGKLDDTQLKALREFLPTKEERFAIDGYIKGASSSEKTKEAAINDFCACEKYMLAMMKVDMADEKFEAMLFKYQFDHKLKEIMNGVTTLIDASEEVQKSVRLRKLMAMILMLGNRINTGGTGNMAHGFTLDALLKLDEAKAFDKKTSVLQYLVKLVKANEPDLLNVHEEMPSIGPAENVVVDGLVSELNELNNQLSSVKGTAAAEGKRIRDGKNPLSKLSPLDRLRQQKTQIRDVEGVNMYNLAVEVDLTAMEKFTKYAEKRAKQAYARIEEVKENFKGVLSYFGEDPAMTSSAFFGTLNKFVAAFDSALEVVKRIEALKIAEEKKEAARRLKEENKKAAAAKKVKSDAQPSSDIVSAQKEKGKLDLAGQRKQFADPFVGPETVASVDSQDTSENALVASGPPPPSKEEEEEPNPRAALMMMLNKRSPPTPTEDEPTAEAEKSNKDKVSKKDDSEKEPNPRAALMSMLNKRSQPPTPVEEEESKTEVAKDDKGEAELDPRASLIKMLGKRQVNDESAVAEDKPNNTSVPSSPGTGFFPATTPTTSSPSSRKGFFPATSPKSSPKARVNQSTREQRYEEKTSSIARASDDVTASPPPPSVVPPEKRKGLYEVTPAIVSSSETEPKKRANRINPHVEADAKTEAKVMLVAAMAAASARNKSPGTALHDESVSSYTDTKDIKPQEFEEKPQQAAPMGIAALAAAAARKKNDKPNDKPPTVPVKSVEEVSKPTPPQMPDLSSSNDEKATNPSGLQCSACGKSLEKKNYSKSQLSKKEKRRCKTCIENQRPISPAGNFN